MNTAQALAFPPVLERAIKYDGRIVEHSCHLLKHQQQEWILHHQVQQGFTVTLEIGEWHIPQGSHTFAYYWLNRPYNAYYWIDSAGRYLGTYFNLVKQTSYAPPVLTFHDLIIDVMSLPNGTVEVLDMEELPVPIMEFENGFVQKQLAELLESLDKVVVYMTEQTVRFLNAGVLSRLT